MVHKVLSVTGQIFLTILLIEILTLYKWDICWISGLGLGNILSKLRNSAHELVQIQVEVFDEKLHRDQAELEKDPLNLSPQQLFDIIYTKVREISISSSSSVSSSDVDLFPFQINQPTRCNNFPTLLLDVYSYVQLNMFRASSRPSSGAQQPQ